MQEEKVDPKKLKSDMNSLIEEQKKIKRMIDLFILALILIFAIYTIF